VSRVETRISYIFLLHFFLYFFASSEEPEPVRHDG
jgi:hypothetical protein